MKFRVLRTSNAGLDGPPCPDAVREGEWWTVEIDDLAALIAFQHRHGNLIIKDHWVEDGGPLVIEIYDDYRE